MKYKCQKCGNIKYLSGTVITTAFKEYGCDNICVCNKCYAEMVKGVKFKDGYVKDGRMQAVQIQ